MGSAASTPTSHASQCHSPCMMTTAVQEELFAQLRDLEQSCEQVRLTSEETYRLITDRYQDYCQSEDKSLFTFENQSVPLPFRMIVKKMNSSELIKSIIRFEDSVQNSECICFACNIKFENQTLLQEHKNYLKTSGGHNIIEPADSLILQSRFNTNTVSGDVATVSRKWKETVSISSRQHYKEISQSLCFIPNEVKVLFQGKKVYHRSCNESVVVDLRVFFHTESCCIEIVPHIVEIIDFSSGGSFSSRQLTARGSYDSSPSVELEEVWGLDFAAERPQSRKTVPGQGQNLVIDTTFSDDKMNAVAFAPSTDLFIPLPRIYLDYNTLLGSVMEQPYYFGSDSLEHYIVTQEVSARYGNLYIPHEERRCAAVDVCMDRLLVHYITSHLELPPMVEVSMQKTSTISIPKSLSLGALSPMKALTLLSPKNAPEIKSPTVRSASIRASTTASDATTMEKTVRANLKSYSLRFNDSDCDISPVFTAPHRLEPVSAECAEPIYVYCHDPSPKFF